jgi:hypothetical protein
MVELSDTSIRAYQKKEGNLSLHFRSKMVIHTKQPTCFSQYVSEMSLSIASPDMKRIEFDEVSISKNSCSDYDLGIEMWDVQAKTITKLRTINAVAVELQFGYIYGKHPVLEMEYITRISPVIKRY